MEAPDKHPQCIECWHYCAEGKQCRKDPPRVVNVIEGGHNLGKLMTSWPHVNPYDWCGTHRQILKLEDIRRDMEPAIEALPADDHRGPAPGLPGAETDG